MAGGIKEIRYVPINKNNPSIVADMSSCVHCGACQRTCDRNMGVYGTYNLANTSGRAVCINCGQCIAACPKGIIRERYEYEFVKKAIENPNKVVVVSTAPAVRIALGDELGCEAGDYVEGKMISLLRELGADYVLDINFAADLTIVEEASELVERITKGTGPLPQFTSCCPAWVKYSEIYHPDLNDNLSTAKSPIGMQGALVKTHFANKMGLDPSDIVNVTIAPCTAKKFEVRRPEMNAAGIHHGDFSMRDTDYVLTTNELSIWARQEEIDFANLEDSKFDSIMGEGSGAGIIFGNTGGVMEAALRTAYEYITHEEAPEVLFELEPVRGMSEVKEATINIAGTDINVAAIHGTKKADEFIEMMKNGDKQYHFIEVMACPGGCANGGGQPKGKTFKKKEIREKRAASLYAMDTASKNRKSHENTELKAMYEEFLAKPLSHLSHELLHTSYEDKSYVLGTKVVSLFDDIL